MIHYHNIGDSSDKTNVQKHHEEAEEKSNELQRDWIRVIMVMTDVVNSNSEWQFD
ncbi:hypothetical protein KIN20_005041 [Parelaphostrongylus tenuis]|uniref:Uncharacterized protein n=1 Tax=Parelaphostrongylus tenuis TaxID=148309 RepID=A0AAD5QEU6_PARTN|nr:hypothetical protein KIN20_005041 [Parelaphostrongylus tenuis]